MDNKTLRWETQMLGTLKETRGDGGEVTLSYPTASAEVMVAIEPDGWITTSIGNSRFDVGSARVLETLLSDARNLLQRRSEGITERIGKE